MNEPTPEGWKLPNLRIDREGDWYDDDVQVTHPGILANLRGNLRKDGQGYFLQTRVRIPVVVEDAPWVVTRVEPGVEVGQIEWVKQKGPGHRGPAVP